MMKSKILKQQICKYPKKAMRYFTVLLTISLLFTSAIVDAHEFKKDEDFKLKFNEDKGQLDIRLAIFYFNDSGTNDNFLESCDFAYKLPGGSWERLGTDHGYDADCNPHPSKSSGGGWKPYAKSKSIVYKSGVSQEPTDCNKHTAVDRKTWREIKLNPPKDWFEAGSVEIRAEGRYDDDKGGDRTFNWTKSYTFSKPPKLTPKISNKCNGINISWQPVPTHTNTAKTYVEIFKDGSDERLGWAYTDKSYTDSTVQIGVEHTYRLKFVYEYDNGVTYSIGRHYGDFSSATTGKRRTVPAPPKKIKADRSFDNTINISWSWEGADPNNFQLYRNDKKLSTVSGNLRAYRDTTGKANTKYKYYIKVTDNCGEGGKSDEIEPSMISAINQAVKCSDNKKTQLKTDFDAKYETLKPDLSKHNYDWFKLIKDPQITTNTAKQTQFSELRSLLVQHLTCAVQDKTYAKELLNKYEGDKTQYVSAGSAGTVGFDSDIDVNLKGHGTEYAVELINDYFHKNVNPDHEPGEMFDINFYAKDFVPELRSDQKEAKTDSTYNFIEEANWIEHTIANSTLLKDDIDFQNMMSLVFMRKNMKETDYNAYIAASAALPKRLVDNVPKEYKIFEDRINEFKDAKSQMAKENRAYEKLLKKAAEKRVLFEKAKKQKANLDATYLDWKKTKTYSTLHANEAHCTAGAILHVVANKQMLERQFNADKKSLKKLALTKHELYQSFNEQIGFTFHKLDHTESAKDLIKVGKYMHRAYNALKHFYLVSGNMPAYTQAERKAATDWEGLKKGMKRDAKGKFTVKLNTDAQKMAELDKILKTFDDAYKAAGLGTALGGRTNIPTTVKNLKQYLIYLKAQVDAQYFTEIVDITPHTFNEVAIPNLKLLGSATSAAAKEQGDKVKYTWNEDKKIATFVSLEITTNDLKKYLKEAMKDTDNKKVYRMGDPTIKKLKIFCETFTMYEDIWLPEAEIIIKADKKIIMGKYSIVTKPLPYHSTLDGEEERIPIGKVKDGIVVSKGQNGLDGGAFTIETLAIEVEKGSKIITNGSDGESVVLDADSYGFEYPKGYKTYEGQDHSDGIRCYSRTGKESVGDWKKGFDVSDKENAIGFVVKYFYISKNTTYTGSWPHYAFIPFNTEKFSCKKGDKEQTGEALKQFYENNSKLQLKDNKSRFKYNVTPKPGMPGGGGKITCSKVYGADIITYETNGGETGYYVKKEDKKKRASLSNIDTKKFTVNKIEYRTKVEDRDWSGKPDEFSTSVSSYTPGFTITYPTNKNFEDMGYNFEHPNGADNMKGEKGEVEKNTVKIAANSDELAQKAELIHQRVFDLSERYENYHKLDTDGQVSLNADNERTKAQLQEMMNKAKNKSAADSKDYRMSSLMETDLSILTNHSLYKNANIDRYGNGPGYRPKHSVVTALANAEKNINTEVELFIRADMFAKEQIEEAEMKAMIPGMKKKIQKQYDKLIARQVAIPEEIKKLTPKADECIEKTKELKKEIEKIRKEIEANAEYEERKKQMLKAGTNALTSIVSAIPYGQPALGAVTNFAGEAINAELEGEDDAMSYALKNVDIEGALSGISEGYIGRMETKKQEAISDYDNTQKYKKDPKLALKIAMGKVIQDTKSQAIGKKLGSKDVESYEQSMKNIKNGINTAGKALVGTRNLINSYQVPKNKLNAIVEKALSENGDARFLKGSIDAQNELKREIFGKANKLTNEMTKNYAEINVTIDNLRHLNLLELNPNSYKDVLKEMRTITDGALDRLALIEYELIKVYEYTVLAEYPNELPSQKVFDVLYKNELKRYKKEGKKIDVEELVKTLTLGYVNELQNVKTYLKNHAESIRNDKEITFYLNKNTAPEILKQLNEGKTAVLDLQKQLLNEVVAPGYADLRLEDLKMTNIKFDGTFDTNTKATLSAKVGNEGIIRKGENYYYFATSYDNDLSNENWEWDIVENNQVIGKSELSEGTVALMQYISGQNYDNKSARLIYTAPPAWTNIILDLEWKRNAALDKSLRKPITEIQFAIKCSFNKSENTRKKVLDVRFQDSAPGAKCLVEEDAGQSNKIEVVETYINYYNLVEVGNTVTLEIPIQKDVSGNIIQPDKVFDKWVVTDTSLIVGDATGRKITLKMDKDLVAIAKFKPNPAIAQNTSTNNSSAGGQ